MGIVGVAPEATLLAAKAFNRKGQGTSADIADAIWGCASLRDQVDPQMPLVVNMSFVASSELIHSAIQDLEAQGVLFSAAAGNWGHPCIGHPARYQEVYGVTGINEDLSLWEHSAYGGAYNGQPCGPNTDPSFTAPASDILSLWKGGGTRTVDGTSMAAAYASGVMALGLSVGNSDPMGTDIGLPTEQQGNGLIDAALNVNNTAPTPDITATPTSIETSEDGDTDQFSVVLDTQPTAAVSISVSSSNVAEGIVVSVTIEGMDDAALDGDQPYQIILDPSSAGDPDYDGLASVVVSATNLDNESPPTVALYVYDIRFESKRGNKDWRAVFEIHSDANGTGAGDDQPISGVAVTVIFAGTEFSGFTDSNGIFRTSWIRNLSGGTHHADATDLALVDYHWDPLALDLEDDSNDNLFPDGAITV